MSVNTQWFKTLVNQIVDWVTRPANVGLRILVATSPILVALCSGGGFSLEVDRITQRGRQLLKFSTGDGLTGTMLSTVTWVILATWLIGLLMAINHVVRDWRETDRRRIICVELRGLVDTADKSLVQAVPKKVKGRREDCFIDVRPYLQGTTPNVSGAIQELSNLQRQVRQRRGGASRDDVTVIAGGVLPVPLLFYAGMLLDDEGNVRFMDWERTKKDWKSLVEADDGGRFDVVGLDAVSVGTSEAVVAIGTSYRPDADAIAEVFQGISVVTLSLPNSVLNNLWSDDKQAALVGQFLFTINKLMDKRVAKVHLILAVPASLALRLGGAYDRNMPEAYIYQYEPASTPKYPWSIQMPRDSQTPAVYVPTAATNRAAA